MSTVSIITVAVVPLACILMSQNDYTSDHFLSLQEPSAEENGKGPLTVAQKKAQNIMESFENPFRMVSNGCVC